MACSVWLYALPEVPEDNDEVRIASGVVAALMVIDIVEDVVCAGDSASATLTVTLYVPFEPERGVPDRTPEELSVNPAGMLFEKDQVYGPVPPVALSVCVNALPTVPVTEEGATIDSGLTAAADCTPVTCSDMGRDAVCVGLLVSVAVAVKFAVPEVEGVPVMAPVVGERDNPAGSWPEVTDH